MTNEVYKITNTITNKIYIGITNLGSGTRYRHHWYESRIGDPTPIHRSMAKYGEENFTIDVIDTASDYDELKEKEKYWIKFYNSMDQNVGYNLTAGGDGTFGKKHSDETKEKIRLKAIGRKMSDEVKLAMSKARKGKCSDKKRKHLQLISLLKRVPVGQYSSDGQLIAQFDSITEASTLTGIHKDTIRTQLRHPLKNVNDWRVKYIWKRITN